MLPDSDCNKETIAHRWLEGAFAMFVLLGAFIFNEEIGAYCDG